MWNLKKINNVSKITKRNRLTNIENKLVVTSKEREAGRGSTGVKSLRGTNYMYKKSYRIYCTIGETWEYIQYF